MMEQDRARRAVAKLLPPKGEARTATGRSVLALHQSLTECNPVGHAQQAQRNTGHPRCRCHSPPDKRAANQAASAWTVSSLVIGDDGRRLSSYRQVGLDAFVPRKQGTDTHTVFRSASTARRQKATWRQACNGCPAADVRFASTTREGQEATLSSALGRLCARP